MASVSPGAGRELPTWCGFGEAPSGDRVRAELDNVLASAAFRSSPALRRFLRYTVEHSIQGEGDRLKEYRLGLEVFGRGSSYDPQKDPIVRLEARRLRAKLREYYEDEGIHDPVRIAVPKGGYAATFSANGHTDNPVSFSAAQSTGRREPRRFRLGTVQLAAGICIVLGVLIAWSAVHNFRPNETNHTMSLAVLPLQNLSEDPAQDVLADEITEALTDHLSQLPGLQVTARNTVLHYKGANADPQKIGQELHANAVLSGRLLEHGNTLIIQTELIDIATGALLWDTQYNRNLTQVQTLQEDISRDVGRHLRLHLKIN
jgi:adenylate cyclase